MRTTVLARGGLPIAGALILWLRLGAFAIAAEDPIFTGDFEVGSACAWSATIPARCSIADVCYDPGAPNPDDACQRCDHDANPTDWSFIPPPSFLVAVTPTLTETTLGTDNHFTVELRSCAHDGTVDLSTSGLPGLWTAGYDVASPTLAPGGTATAELTVSIPSTGPAGAAPFDVIASTAAGSKTVSTELDAANELVVRILLGSGTGTEHGFPLITHITLGTQVRFINDDTTEHQIHGSGVGFPHQPAPMGQGGEHAVTPGATGNYHYYCHVHGYAVQDSILSVQ